MLRGFLPFEANKVCSSVRRTGNPTGFLDLGMCPDALTLVRVGSWPRMPGSCLDALVASECKDADLVRPGRPKGTGAFPRRLAAREHVVDQQHSSAKDFSRGGKSALKVCAPLLDGQPDLGARGPDSFEQTGFDQFLRQRLTEQLGLIESASVPA